MSNKLISHNSCHNFLLSLETQGIKLGLSRTKKLLDCCENPQKQIKTIQIIGTKQRLVQDLNLGYTLLPKPFQDKSFDFQPQE